jgi:iron(III) transport system substrate-binding protein
VRQRQRRGAGRLRPLVLYTSQPNADAQRTVDAFMAAYPDVEVEWVRDGTTEVMARLEAEFAAGARSPTCC